MGLDQKPPMILHQHSDYLTYISSATAVWHE